MTQAAALQTVRLQHSPPVRRVQVAADQGADENAAGAQQADVLGRGDDPVGEPSRSDGLHQQIFFPDVQVDDVPVLLEDAEVGGDRVEAGERRPSVTFHVCGHLRRPRSEGQLAVYQGLDSCDTGAAEQQDAGRDRR